MTYSRTENGLKSVNEIMHPTVREAMKLLGIGTGIQIVSILKFLWEELALGPAVHFLWVF